MKTLFRVALVCLLGWSVSCNSNSENKVVYRELIDILNNPVNNEKYSLVVSTVTKDCPACHDFIRRLYEAPAIQSLLASHVDVYLDSCGANDQLSLCEVSNTVNSPTSYLFSPKGKLLTIITGNKWTEPQIYNEIIAAVKGKPSLSLFSVTAPMKKDALIKMYNTEIEFVRNFGNGTIAAEDIDALKKSIDSTPYFMNSYLMHKYFLSQGDSVASIVYAKKSLTNVSAMSEYIYASRLEEVRSFIDPLYQKANSRLSFDATKKDLGEVKIGIPVRSAFFMFNRGSTPIMLTNVQAACGCTDVQWPQKPILPGSRELMEFTFMPSHTGKFSKGIMVFSNATNKIEHLVITGTVVN